MTAERAYVSVLQAVDSALARMNAAGVPPERQVEWVRQELTYLADRAVDFQRMSDLAAASLARKAETSPATP